MNHTHAATTYARLTPRRARAVLVAIVVAMIAGVAVTLSPSTQNQFTPDPTRQGDVQLYRAEIDRIQHGEGYYHAAAAELTPRGYPTQSVFNWRTPLPMWLIGKMPAVVWGKVLLGAMALTLALMAFEASAREEHRTPYRSMACVLLMVGCLMPTVLDNLFVMPSLWAGVLIALSVCAYGIDRPRLGVFFGLLAVVFRELALPYGLLCAAIAWKQRRRRELAAWTIGLLAWLGLYALHFWHVRGWIAPDAIAHQHGWIRFGGAGFVIATVQMNFYLLPLPQWVAAVYLVAALVGLAGWNTPLGTRVGLTCCLFLAAFAVVGQSFNQYWGMLIAPLLCFGVVRFPISLRELHTAACIPSLALWERGRG